MTSRIYTALFLLATTCYAQDSEPTVPFAAVLNLNTPSSVNSSADCASYDKGPDAVLIRLYSNFTDSCYNLDSVFSPNQDDLDFYSDDVADTCHPISANCKNDYQASILPNYSPDANYSFTRFQMGTTGFWGSSDEDEDFSSLTLKVFPKEDCIDSESEPWVSWGGCKDEQSSSCSELPYGVKSFRLEHTAEEDRDECLLAAERGFGVRVKANVAVMVAGVVIAGFMIGL